MRNDELGAAAHLFVVAGLLVLSLLFMLMPLVLTWAVIAYSP